MQKIHECWFHFEIIRRADCFYIEIYYCCRYWIFRSWGRVGKDIGDSKCHEYKSLDEALEKFLQLYEEKTKNTFNTQFSKRCGKFHRLNTSHKEFENLLKEPWATRKSALAKSVQDLLKLLTNENIINDLMIKFNIDLNKMPLGKIEQKQINNALLILMEINIKIKKNISRAELVEASNRFFSWIPQKVSSGDVINTKKKLLEKARMLNSLKAMKFTYELLHKESGEKADCLDLDSFYGKLQAQIKPLEKDSEEFNVINKYVQNTSMNFILQVEEIFEIQRNGDDTRYKAYESFPNRVLLWHGSRITNFNSIIAQGLLIEPPGEHTFGHMFGKGLYFSDVIANAAYYCVAKDTDGIGLILLCEVALGESAQYLQPEYSDELPEDKQSVLGVGRHSFKSPYNCLNGALVPSGKPVENKNIETFLDYNEFVVYKNEQVKIKYLVKLKFIDTSKRCL